MKATILALLLTINFSLSAATLSSHWYDLTEDTSKRVDSRESEVDEFVDSLHNLTNSSIPTAHSEFDKSDKKWQLSQFKTVLAIGLSGKIGLKSWGGEKAVELGWAPRSSETKRLLEKNDNDSTQTIKVSEDMELTDLEAQLSPILDELEGSGKLKSRQALDKFLEKPLKDFLEISKALSQTEEYKWRPAKLRLDLNLGASKKLTGTFVKAGVDIRVRLEWTRSKSSKAALQKSSSAVNMKIVKTMNKLSKYVSSNVDQDARKMKLKLKKFKVGVGIGAKKTFGVINYDTSIIPQVYYKKFEVAKSLPQDSVDEEIPFLVENEDKWLFSRRYKVKKYRIRKALRKSLKFGKYWQGKLAKSKYKKRKWGVKSFKTSYAFSLSGKVGATTLKAKPVLELEFANTNF